MQLERYFVITLLPLRLSGIARNRLGKKFTYIIYIKISRPLLKFHVFSSFSNNSVAVISILKYLGYEKIGEYLWKF